MYTFIGIFLGFRLSGEARFCLSFNCFNPLASGFYELQELVIVIKDRAQGVHQCNDVIRVLCFNLIAERLAGRSNDLIEIVKLDSLV
jgi:hypothetical protein